MFDYIYIYRDGKMYEINRANELYIFDISLSKRERLGIVSELKKEGLYL